MTSIFDDRFSTANNQIFKILDLLESSQKEESDSDVNFIVSALFKKFFNA